MGIGAATFGLTGAAIGAEDASSFKDEFGISDEFIKQVGGMVQPGQSAVFVLAHASDPQAAAEQFRGYGGTIPHNAAADSAAKSRNCWHRTVRLLIEPRNTKRIVR
jgi:uncharacterized membrane protein